MKILYKKYLQCHQTGATFKILVQTVRYLLYMHYFDVMNSYLIHCNINVQKNSLIFHQCRIYASVKWVSIASGNGLPHIRHQAITSINADLLSIWPLGTNFSEFWIKIKIFHSWTCIWKISSAKWRTICPGEDELTRLFHRIWYPCAVYFRSVIIHREMPMIKLITDNQQMEKIIVYPIE